MKIIQISDCHIFADANKVGYNHIKPLESLACILAKIKHHRPDVLLVTGDISGDGSAQSYLHFSNALQATQLDCQVAVIPGNHDNQQQLTAHTLRLRLWSTHQQLALSNQWHIHLLNTQDKDTTGRISKESISATREYVSQHSDDYHMLVSHHHPIECGGWMDKHEWTNRYEFNAMIAKQSSIKAVIYGHIHMATEQRKKHCLYMSCPATCWQFANTESFATSDAMPGFRVINLLKNGQITTSIQRLEG